jgi:hypothetical protein
MARLRCDLCDDEDAVFHCADCSYNFCSLVSVARQMLLLRVGARKALRSRG